MTIITHSCNALVQIKHHPVYTGWKLYMYKKFKTTYHLFKQFLSNLKQDFRKLFEQQNDCHIDSDFTLWILQLLDQAFCLAIFSKLKGGKTQHFSKLKQIFCKTQGKYLKTQHFGKFCRERPFFNISSQRSDNDVIYVVKISVWYPPL